MPRQTATHSIQAPPPSSAPTIPYLFSPRSYQLPVFEYMDIPGRDKRAITVWHRRAGKDITWLNVLIREMLVRPFCGTYLMIYPTLKMGRQDLWDAKTSKDSGGRPFRAHFPQGIILESSETEMQITLKPTGAQNPQPISDSKGQKKFVGSILQIMGTDKDSIENLRGINVAGAVFSEFAMQNRAGWDEIIEPVVTENGGWAAFDFTPKGKNHAYDLYMKAKANPNWFTSHLSIEQTVRDAPGESGLPVMTVDAIDEMRSMGKAEEIIQQEYYCSFEGFLKGTIYGDLIVAARKDNRIGRVAYHSGFPAGAFFDIGRSDGTAIWIYQRIGQEIRFIDYIEDRGKGADYYAHELRNRPYLITRLILPHDARMVGYSATQSTEDYMRRAVCRRVDIAEKCSVQSGIDMVRRCFSRFIFDEVKCAKGIEHLESYKRKWDEEKNDYSGEPIHDQHSHAADALRHGIVGGGDEPFEFLADSGRNPVSANSEFAVFGERIQ